MPLSPAPNSRNEALGWICYIKKGHTSNSPPHPLISSRNTAYSQVHIHLKFIMSATLYIVKSGMQDVYLNIETQDMDYRLFLNQSSNGAFRVEIVHELLTNRERQYIAKLDLSRKPLYDIFRALRQLPQSYFQAYPPAHWPAAIIYFLVKNGLLDEGEAEENNDRTRKFITDQSWNLVHELRICGTIHCSLC